MAKLEGKLPFVGAVYHEMKSKLVKIRVVERERVRNGPTIIHFQYEHGKRDVIYADIFYDAFKRCKEGTAFHIEEGWNE